MFFRLFIIFLLIAPFMKAGAISTPHILSDSDEALYQEAFRLEKNGKHKEVDVLLNKVENTLLKGDLLFERYFSNSYHSKGNELSEWLKLYGDHSEAKRVYDLAQKKGVKSPQKPISPKRTYHLHSSQSRYASMIRNHYSSLYVNKKIKAFNQAIHLGHSKNAKDILNDSKFKKEIRETDYDRMCATLAFMYYLDGMYARAKEWLEQPVKNGSGKALWVRGLIHYVEKEYGEAGVLFEQYADLSSEPLWQNATGGYWAYRSYDEAGESGKAEKMLQKTSEIGDSFYGILARQRLGLNEDIEWTPFRITSEDAQEILSWKGGLRALALIQIGELEKAENELRYLLKHDDSTQLIRSVLALSGQENLPNFAMDTARQFINSEANPDLYSSALYPVPDWKPNSGWTIDQALVFAVARQESRFKPNAKSFAGAKGLMQVMPQTASFIAKDNSLKKDQERLYHPEYNIDLGQKYLEFLMRLLGGETDLIRVLASYNAGPKTVLDFDKEESKHRNDPLLYLESFPAKETRAYVKNVLINLWMYRGRLGEKPESLVALSENEWPTYAPQMTAKK
ncbi:MAG: lytic transglycosylase domain-containing protein [Alphaproteobacteria bacterium]|nr:lytic transglycosylase domain-containing protein [Alphaproteobacteria bacterium]